MKMKRTSGISIAACALAALAAGCGSEVPEGFLGSGTLEAEEVVVSAEAPGRIVRLYAEEGDLVAAGDTLALIDDSKARLREAEATSAVAAAEAQARQAEATLEALEIERANTLRKLERMKSLGRTRTVSQQTVDDLEAAARALGRKIEAARAALEAARAQKQRAQAALDLVRATLSDACVLAPRKGTVLESYVEEGELASPGRPLLRLADLSSMRLRIYIAEPDLASIRIGGRLDVVPDGLEERGPIAGVVRWISSEAEFTPGNVQTRDARADLVFAVEVEVPNPDGALKRGLPAEAYLPAEP